MDKQIASGRDAITGTTEDLADTVRDPCDELVKNKPDDADMNDVGIETDASVPRGFDKAVVDADVGI